MSKNLSRIYSGELEGIDAKLIEVEVDLNVGIHAFNIVGLADKALNEAKERVNAAIKNSDIKPPNQENRRITVNLAPADIKKTGSQYDLAIAIGYIVATGQIQKFDTDDKLFLGELALDGRLRPVNGVLNIVQMAGLLGFKSVFVPKENANEASVIMGVNIIAVEKLSEVLEILEGRKGIEKIVFQQTSTNRHIIPDFSDIKGQSGAKRALLVAAAGGHNVLMIGPPGVGKSFLAQAIAGILPDLSTKEAIEITKIWSAAGLRPGRLVSERPFRSPHSTASIVAIVGGGQDPKPGEISLAHRGILFLDELPEFQKNVLEALRQPLESGRVHIARAKHSLVFPAKFSLIAAMNPCPCGYYGDLEQDCKCSAYEVIKYQKKISGPLLDRIDIQIKVGKVKIDELRRGEKLPPASVEMKKNIELARAIQAERFADMEIHTNAEMGSREAERMIALDDAAEKFLTSIDKNRFSPRSYYRVLKVARTIADLEKVEIVSAEHLAEAFSYRLRDEIWE